MIPNVMIPNVMTPHVMILHMMGHVVMAPMMTTVPQDMLVTGEYDASEVPGQEVGGGQGRTGEDRGGQGRVGDDR